MSRHAPPRPLTDAQRRLVEENVGLVFAVLGERSRGVPHDDERVSAAFYGLVRAAMAFRPDRGFRFSTYACDVIRKTIRRCWTEDRLVHIPAAYFGEAGRKLRPEYAAAAAKAGTVLGFPDVGEDFELVDPDGEDIAEREARDDRIESFRRAIADLPPRMRAVMRARARGETLATIGGTLRLSRERIRQIEADAIERLRSRPLPAAAEGGAA